jgi:hypothetical protein
MILKVCHTNTTARCMCTWQNTFLSLALKIFCVQFFYFLFRHSKTAIFRFYKLTTTVATNYSAMSECDVAKFIFLNFNPKFPWLQVLFARKHARIYLLPNIFVQFQGYHTQALIRVLYYNFKSPHTFFVLNLLNFSLTFLFRMLANDVSWSIMCTANYGIARQFRVV